MIIGDKEMDLHEFVSKQSFLLGQVYGMVSSNISNQHLYEFMRLEVGRLYYGIDTKAKNNET